MVERIDDMRARMKLVVVDIQDTCNDLRRASGLPGVEYGPTATQDRDRRGGDWILDAPAEAPAVWGGASGTVAWPEGEPLLIVGRRASARPR
jgi:hypothetical protein